MGIKDLLPHLKSIQQDKHLDDFGGLRAAVDAYSWLHQAKMGIAFDLALGKGLDKFVNNVIRKVQLLQSSGVTPILVFDGGKLGMKQHTESNREVTKALRKAQELYDQGQIRDAGYQAQGAIDITPHMAFAVIQVRSFNQALQEIKVTYQVAPFEADAQLAYLQLNGLADFVIAEDSDMIPFGVTKVFYKMDNQGRGRLIDMSQIKNVTEPLNLSVFTFEQLLDICIMSGCDYLDNIKGIGFKKAFKLFYDHKSLENVLMSIRKEGKYIIPIGYEDNFEKARLTFRFQKVWDPINKQMINLHNPEKDQMAQRLNIHQDQDFLGKNLENAKDICEAIVCPICSKEYKQSFTLPILLKKTKTVMISPGGFTKSLDQYFGKNEPVKQQKIMFKKTKPESNLFNSGQKKQINESSILDQYKFEETKIGSKIQNFFDPKESPSPVKEDPVARGLFAYRRHEVQHVQKRKKYEDRSQKSLMDMFDKCKYSK